MAEVLIEREEPTMEVGTKPSRTKSCQACSSLSPVSFVREARVSRMTEGPTALGWSVSAVRNSNWLSPLQRGWMVGWMER